MLRTGHPITARKLLGRGSIVSRTRWKGVGRGDVESDRYGTKTGTTSAPGFMPISRYTRVEPQLWCDVSPNTGWTYSAPGGTLAYIGDNSGFGRHVRVSGTAPSLVSVLTGRNAIQGSGSGAGVISSGLPRSFTMLAVYQLVTSGSQVGILEVAHAGSYNDASPRRLIQNNFGTGRYVLEDASDYGTLGQTSTSTWYAYMEWQSSYTSSTVTTRYRTNLCQDVGPETVTPLSTLGNEEIHLFAGYPGYGTATLLLLRVWDTTFVPITAAQMCALELELKTLFPELPLADATAALSTLASDGSGSLATGFTGTGSAALSELRLDASGSETFGGTGSAAMSTLTLSASGTEVFTGTGSAALSGLDMAASGSETFTGSGSCALSPLALSGSGAEAFTGTGTCALSPLALSGAGTETFAATGSAALSPLALSASGAETFTGAASVALQPLALDGSGSQALGVTGSGSVALSPFALSGSGTYADVFTGSGSLAMPTLAMSATGAETFAGSGSAALQPLGASGSGSEAFSGTASIALSPLALSATGDAANPVSGSGSLALATLDSSGSAEAAFVGAGSLALSPLALAALGVTTGGTLAVALTTTAGLGAYVGVTATIATARTSTAGLGVSATTKAPQ